MERHNPQIVRTVLLNTAKNVVYSIPGAEMLRTRLLGSPFAGRPSRTDNSWCLRRSKQVDQILSTYIRVWGDDDWLRNKVVVELGSGADVSMPFCFALLGASGAYATDVPEIEGISLSDELRDLVEAVISRTMPRNRAIDRNQAEAVVSRKSHLRAEQLARAFFPESVDLIVSTSTLEHVDYPAAPVAQMRLILRRGGRMVHAIAFGNHCCGEGEQDRLGHLYYSDEVWNMMFSHRVGHNRLRWFEWKRLLEGAGFDIVDYQLTTVPSAEVAEARPRLASRFATMSDEQLGPSYAVVCCSNTS